MKKLFFICCIAISAFALGTSATANKHQIYAGSWLLNDTVPGRTLDTMHKNWNKDTMHHNMMDTGMVNKRDSTKPAPPYQ